MSEIQIGWRPSRVQVGPQSLRIPAHSQSQPQKDESGYLTDQLFSRAVTGRCVPADLPCRSNIVVPLFFMQSNGEAEPIYAVKLTISLAVQRT
jgi:hypothetical protein